LQSSFPQIDVAKMVIH